MNYEELIRDIKNESVTQRVLDYMAYCIIKGD